jgi:molybdate transport system substrate-binding protein
MTFLKALVLSFCMLSHIAYAGTTCTKNNTVHVAVTANFSATFLTLSQQFMQQTPYCVKSSVAATGILYTEIIQGAPFDIFLAADSLRPQLLEQQHLTFAKPITYAIGQLVLVASEQAPGFDARTFLKTRPINLATSNPKLAPYGQAAKEVLLHLELWPQLKEHLLMANDVNQALMYLTTGAADAAFISLSQLRQLQQQHQYNNSGYWLVPENFYKPIIQQAVLLNTAKNNGAALAFFDYLQSKSAVNIIENAGYKHEH